MTDVNREQSLVPMAILEINAYALGTFHSRFRLRVELGFCQAAQADHN